MVYTIYKPHFLSKIHKSSDTECKYCNNILIRKIKKKNILLQECGYCRYSMRPFVYCNSSWESHYPGGCSCDDNRELMDVLHITCSECMICINCNGINDKSMISETDRHINFCEKCEKNEDKKDFFNTWKDNTPQEKIKYYGTEKLKKLAKRKGLIGYSKYKKEELINTLSPLVNDSDFPIK